MTIALIGAMEGEIKDICQALTHKKEIQIFHHTFIQGELFGQAVVIAEAGIGKVRSSITTTLVLEHFQPKWLINIGTAGALATHLKIGDVVLASEVRYCDVDVTGFGYVYGQVPQMPEAYQPRVLSMKATDIAQGLVVSGDSFISDQAVKNQILSYFPSALCVDMESAAIAQVCHIFKVPFSIFRAVTDTADQDAELSHQAFLEMASYKAAQLLEKLFTVA